MDDASKALEAEGEDRSPGKEVRPSRTGPIDILRNTGVILGVPVVVGFFYADAYFGRFDIDFFNFATATDLVFIVLAEWEELLMLLFVYLELAILALAFIVVFATSFALIWIVKSIFRLLQIFTKRRAENIQNLLGRLRKYLLGLCEHLLGILRDTLRTYAILVLLVAFLVTCFMSAELGAHHAECIRKYNDKCAISPLGPVSPFQQVGIGELSLSHLIRTNESEGTNDDRSDGLSSADSISSTQAAEAGRV